MVQTSDTLRAADTMTGATVDAAPPSVAPLMAAFYAEAPHSVRLRLLDRLLQPVGPLALGALAAGAFARLLPPERWTGVQLRLEDVMRIGAQPVFELTCYLEQKCPEWLLQLPDLLGDGALTLGTLSGAMLLVALRAARRRAPPVATRGDAP